MKKSEEKIKECEQLKNENKELKNKINELNKYTNDMEKMYNNEFNKINAERFFRLNYQYIKQHGFLDFLHQIGKFIVKLFKIFIKKIKNKFKNFKYKKELRKILKENKGKSIFLFYPGYDWHMKMYQRPQHMAIQFAQKNILFFYCTTNINEKIDGFEKIKDGLYVTNLYKYLKKKLPKYTLYMCANMNGCYIKELKQIIKKNNLLYEYIDDLHEDITDISHDLIERHNYVLNANIPVITTAHYLYEKAKKIRESNKNILLSTNGVVYEDFHITKEKKLKVPENMKKIVNQKKPIIGYYVALAKWFDYELIEEIAKKHEDWNIILIGIDYDKSLKKYNYFNDYKNVFYLGIVEYKKLIEYGNCCDVLTIPFLINEITLSTSPVKVFEYMSMEKPIVTTDLPECRKYKSVDIGKNHDEFIKLLEDNIKYKANSNKKELLKKEALENTWEKKVNQILLFLNEEGKN